MNDQDFNEALNLALMLRARDQRVPKLEPLQRPDFVGKVGVSFASVKLKDADLSWDATFKGALERSRMRLMLSGRTRTFVEEWRTPGGSTVHLECEGAYTRLLALDYPIRARLFGRPTDIDERGAAFPTNWLWYSRVQDKGPGVDFGLRET